MNDYHKPVLLKEVLDLLQIKKNKKYIDATVGGGGHTEQILKNSGQVLGIDTDTDAIEFVKNRLHDFKDLVLEKGNFNNLKEITLSKKFNPVSGILFDLGVSSNQIDTPERGFSFLRNGPLDMRMDKDSHVTADYLVNLLSKGELYEIFKNLGQESRAFVISNSIVKSRRVKAIKTTAALAEVVKQAYGFKGEISDFNKNLINQKTFQALRMAVNMELENIKTALPQALEVLDAGGRIVVISFHSLEDRMVKQAFLDFERKNIGKIITKKPIVATKEETIMNSRSKSAKLRVFEKN